MILARALRHEPGFLENAVFVGRGCRDKPPCYSNQRLMATVGRLDGNGGLFGVFAVQFKLGTTTMHRLRLSLFWAALNVAGIGFYVHFGMALWVRPGEEGLPGGPGDAFYWFLTQVPIAVFFLLLNFAALIAILMRMRRTREPSPLYLWLAIAVIWLVAVAYDHHKAYRVISPEYSVSGAHHVA